MESMYKVKPIFDAEEVVLPNIMYYVKPIADFDSGTISPIKPSQPLSAGSQTQAIGKVVTNDSESNNNSVNHGASGDREDKGEVSKSTTVNKTQTANKSEKKNSPKEKKSKKGKSQQAPRGEGDKQSSQDNQSKDDSGKQDQKSAGDGSSGSKGNSGQGDDDEPVPFVPDNFAPVAGVVIGDIVVQDICIQADYDYKPLRVLKVINHLRKNFGLRIAVKVHIGSSVLTEAETNIDEWRMFETFESTILPRHDNQLIVTLVVKKFSPSELWLNKQPFMVLDPNLGTAIFGEVNIARYIARVAQEWCPDVGLIYPENDPEQASLVKDIDETLNEIQRFLFTRDLKDKQAKLQLPADKDKRQKHNTDLDTKLTLDSIVLLSLKL